MHACYSDTETIKLDFDGTPFKTVRYWALRTMQWHKLEGFIILKSRKNNYHVVFDRTVSLLSHNAKLLKWFVMQCIKEGLTLRISPKREKTSPRLVCRYGKQDREIKNYLEG